MPDAMGEVNRVTAFILGHSGRRFSGDPESRPELRPFIWIPGSHLRCAPE
jgi:hypothetical protein